MKTVTALLCGSVFGVGLALSGMTNPAKILAFLDVFGAWDPTLAFVMGGALVVSAAGYAVSGQRDQAWFGDSFAIPTRRDIDSSLLGGAALFGIGWGLVGLCPGPALANLSRGSLEVVVFVAAMLAGVAGYRLLTRDRPESAFESDFGSEFKPEFKPDFDAHFSSDVQHEPDSRLSRPTA